MLIKQKECMKSLILPLGAVCIRTVYHHYYYFKKYSSKLKESEHDVETAE